MSLKQRQASEVASKVLNKEDLFILDVRNEEAYGDWKIEGESVTSINVPYFDLIDGVEDLLPELPKDKEILVVCAKEGSSVFVGEELIEAGIENVSYLSGGMKAWSEYLEPVKVGDLPGGALYQFVRIGKGCLSYLVESNGEAAVVDATRMIENYTTFAENKGLTIKATMDTHLHADHISGGKALADQANGTYYLPEEDAGEVTFPFTALKEGNNVTIGEVTIEPIYSPGHTIGSTSLMINDAYLLTGDILFVESIGRPDLAGKAEDWVLDLRTTLYNRYKEMAGELVVLPAHFSKMAELGETGVVSAKLEELYEKNEGLHVEEEAEFRRMVTENLPPQPNAYQEIRETNMGKITPDEETRREMEIGPNRCAVN
ncbi:MBL fold metallo-hydrolase [Alkalihalobacillus macyae]|uniref:MBL fold metallo-hydrolase n=1 Tax=Guptibacillus hwajinpoensis TaxID=208199 RepID=UPI00273AF50B|nr:MBL fold metallo-hydrolase [Alkalihalobacillus macyae]MDP4551944.1 MBL fold metallo-hydrolase [Alkalihalobacillus macyae]